MGRTEKLTKVRINLVNVRAPSHCPNKHTIVREKNILCDIINRYHTNKIIATCINHVKSHDSR